MFMWIWMSQKLNQNIQNLYMHNISDNVKYILRILAKLHAWIFIYLWKGNKIYTKIWDRPKNSYIQINPKCIFKILLYMNKYISNEIFTPKPYLLATHSGVIFFITLLHITMKGHREPSWTGEHIFMSSICALMSNEYR